MSYKDQLISNNLPKHVAIIMDGNGRWAKKQGHNRVYGHRHGVQSVRNVVEAAGQLQIPYLTLYAFSTENWKRPKLEIDALMTLLSNTIDKEIDSLIESNVILNTIGNIDSMPSQVREKLKKAIELTASNTGLTLTLALSYSARWEIMDAVKKRATKVQEGSMDIDTISQNSISENLQTANMPDPELLIRTSGEHRISNFLLWQIAYAELFFTPKYWPEFEKEDFYEALFQYQQRERRFGQTSEQLV